MKILLAAAASILLIPVSLWAGLPDEDAAVNELYLTYQSGTVPPLEWVQPGTLWHCTYYQAERENYYRASTFLKFYKQRKDKVIRSVTQVNYPRRVKATTYYAFTSYGFVSLPAESNVYASIRKTGPYQMVIEHFQAQGPLGGGATPERYPALTAPGSSFGYSACVPVN